METERQWWRSGMAGVVGIALTTVVVHLIVGWRYGFDRDELLALEDARHLAWGYVQYPPMTAFFGWVALKLFGTSLGGFRFFAALVQAVALVLTGLMAKELGGGKWARMTAALAGVPFCLGAGALMQYISFDYLCWVLVAWGMVKLVTAENRNSKIENRNSEAASAGARATADGEGFLVSQTLLGMTGLREGEAERGGKPPLPSGMWWVVVGAGIGLGMLAKYTMGLLVAGVVVGVLATPMRRHLRNPWLWAGVALSVAIFLPNLLWEWRHGFVTAEFLRFLHERDVREGVTDGFLVGQLRVTLLAAPVAMAGLWFCFTSGRRVIRLREHRGHREEEKDNTEARRTQRFAQEKIEDPPANAPPDGPRYRVLGWMYVVPLVLLMVLQGRDYYLAPAYPMLYAAGAVWVEQRSKEAREQGSKKENGKWKIENGQDAGVEILRAPAFTGRQMVRPPFANAQGKRFEAQGTQDDSARASDLLEVNVANRLRRRSLQAGWVRRGIWAALLVDVVVAGAVALPIAPVNSRWWKLAAQVDPVFPEEIGWEEFTHSVADVWRQLPEAERGHAGILAGNYGEVGALNLYGERFGLPRAMSGVNSSWARGYGEKAPETLVVVGYPRELLEKYFASCAVGGRVWNKYGVANEETVEDPDIFVCRGLRGDWGEFWRAVRKFA